MGAGNKKWQKLSQYLSRRNVAGDIFEKLEDEDEQGWCKGRKEGKIGLYPASYVEEIGNPFLS